MMKHLAWLFGIGFFGGLGTLGRFALTQCSIRFIGAGHSWGTFAVNVFGCFLFGILVGFFEAETIPKEWRAILLTGFLGGFTTFSAFAHENLVLLEHRQWFAFGLHFAGQTIFGLVAVLAGLQLAGKTIPM